MGARETPALAVRARLPPEIRAAVPSRYERVGDIVLLKLPGAVASRRQIAAAYAAVLGARTVIADGGIRGAWREPVVETLYGGDTETVHLEDGVRFKLDVARLMFSSGNFSERKRMGRTVRPGETVVDLFAGIGYFVIPMAVHGTPARIVACEANPVAFHYLQENVRLNRASSVESRLGDCRDVAPAGVADRIVMGYLDGESFLDVAMRTAKDECAVHYHESTPIEEIPDGPFSRVCEAANAAGFRAELVAVHRIKSYAPRIEHVVLDVRVTR